MPNLIVSLFYRDSGRKGSNLISVLPRLMVVPFVEFRSTRITYISEEKYILAWNLLNEL